MTQQQQFAEGDVVSGESLVRPIRSLRNLVIYRLTAYCELMR